MNQYNLQKLNVLVIEKHHLMRRLMRDVMKSLGVENVEAVASDEVDEEKNAHFRPDVIFADWSPGCDGIELIREIRKEQSKFDRCLPVVLVSSFTEMRQVCEARDAGITEFLAKPVSAHLIYRRICSMVENPRDFVQTGDFFGPDRRRRSLELSGPERRSAPANANAARARGGERAAVA